MLMLGDRKEISRGLAESLEYKEIGLRLGRDGSVISREVARHGGRERYRAVAAHEMAGAAGAAQAVRGRALGAPARGGLPAAARRVVPGVDRGPVAGRVRRRRV